MKVQLLGALACLVFAAGTGYVIHSWHEHDVAEDRAFHAPENCRPYAEEPHGGGASCPRRSHRARVEKLGNGGALLVCECPDKPVQVSR